MTKYIKIDLEMGFSSVCDTEDEVIEGCGYELGELTFDELLKRSRNVYEIIKIEGDFKIDYLSD